MQKKQRVSANVPIANVPIANDDNDYTGQKRTRGNNVNVDNLSINMQQISESPNVSKGIKKQAVSPDKIDETYYDTLLNKINDGDSSDLSNNANELAETVLFENYIDIPAQPFNNFINNEIIRNQLKDFFSTSISDYLEVSEDTAVEQNAENINNSPCEIEMSLYESDDKQLNCEEVKEKQISLFEVNDIQQKITKPEELLKILTTAIAISYNSIISPADTDKSVNDVFFLLHILFNLKNSYAADAAAEIATAAYKLAYGEGANTDDYYAYYIKNYGVNPNFYDVDASQVAASYDNSHLNNIENNANNIDDKYERAIAYDSVRTAAQLAAKDDNDKESISRTQKALSAATAVAANNDVMYNAAEAAFNAAFNANEKIIEQLGLLIDELSICKLTIFYFLCLDFYKDESKNQPKNEYENDGPAGNSEVVNDNQNSEEVFQIVNYDQGEIETPKPIDGIGDKLDSIGNKTIDGIGDERQVKMFTSLFNRAFNRSFEEDNNQVLKKNKNRAFEEDNNQVLKKNKFQAFEEDNNQAFEEDNNQALKKNKFQAFEEGNNRVFKKYSKKIKQSNNLKGGNCDKINESYDNMLMALKFKTEFKHDFKQSQRTSGYPLLYSSKLYDDVSAMWTTVENENKKFPLPPGNEIEDSLVTNLSSSHNTEESYMEAIINSLKMHCQNVTSDFMYDSLTEYTVNIPEVNGTKKIPETEVDEILEKFNTEINAKYPDQYIFIKPLSGKGDVTKRNFHLFITEHKRTDSLSGFSDYSIGPYMEDMNLDKMVLAFSIKKKALYTGLQTYVKVDDFFKGGSNTGLNPAYISSMKLIIDDVFTTSTPATNIGPITVFTPSKLIDPINSSSITLDNVLHQTSGKYDKLSIGFNDMASFATNVNNTIPSLAQELITMNKLVYDSTIEGINTLLGFWITISPGLQLIDSYNLISSDVKFPKELDTIEFKNSNNTFWKVQVGDTTVSNVCETMITIFNEYNTNPDKSSPNFITYIQNKNGISASIKRIFNVACNIINHPNFKFKLLITDSKSWIIILLTIISFLKSCGDEYQRLTNENLANKDKKMFLITKDKVLVATIIAHLGRALSCLVSPHDLFPHTDKNSDGIILSNITRTQIGVLTNTNSFLTNVKETFNTKYSRIKINMENKLKEIFTKLASASTALKNIDNASRYTYASTKPDSYAIFNVIGAAYEDFSKNASNAFATVDSTIVTLSAAAIAANANADAIAANANAASKTANDNAVANATKAGVANSEFEGAIAGIIANAKSMYDSYAPSNVTAAAAIAASAVTATAESIAADFAPDIGNNIIATAKNIKLYYMFLYIFEITDAKFDAQNTELSELIITGLIKQSNSISQILNCMEYFDKNSDDISKHIECDIKIVASDILDAGMITEVKTLTNNVGLNTQTGLNNVIKLLYTNPELAYKLMTLFPEACNLFNAKITAYKSIFEQNSDKIEVIIQIIENTTGIKDAKGFIINVLVNIITTISKLNETATSKYKKDIDSSIAFYTQKENLNRSSRAGGDKVIKGGISHELQTEIDALNEEIDNANKVNEANALAVAQKGIAKRFLKKCQSVFTKGVAYMNKLIDERSKKILILAATVKKATKDDLIALQKLFNKDNKVGGKKTRRNLKIKQKNTKKQKKMLNNLNKQNTKIIKNKMHKRNKITRKQK